MSSLSSKQQIPSLLSQSSPVTQKSSSLFPKLFHFFWFLPILVILAGIGLMVGYFKISSENIECIENTSGIENFENEFCKELTKDTETDQGDKKSLDANKALLKSDDKHVAFDWAPSQNIPDSGTTVYFKGSEKNTNQCYKAAKAANNREGNIEICFKLVKRNDGLAIGGAITIVIGLVILTFMGIKFMFPVRGNVASTSTT